MRRTSRGSAFGNTPKSFRDNSAHRSGMWSPEIRSLPLNFAAVPLSRTLWAGDVGQTANVPVEAMSPSRDRSRPVSSCPPLWSPLWTAMRVPSATPSPIFIPPWLPSPSQKAPSGSAWVREIKHDGYRLIARRDGNWVRLYTRRGYDWSGKYPWIVTSANISGGVGVWVRATQPLSIHCVIGCVILGPPYSCI